VVEPVPFGPSVDPLGEVFISELPEGFVLVPGPPGVMPVPVPVLWPVVVPGEPPGEEVPIDDEPVPPLDVPPDMPPAPPAPPPAPPACANAIELESAIAPANAIVFAIFMDRFPCC
jgi:hypothetical protein